MKAKILIQPESSLKLNLVFHQFITQHFTVQWNLSLNTLMYISFSNHRLAFPQVLDFQEKETTPSKLLVYLQFNSPLNF